MLLERLEKTSYDLASYARDTRRYCAGTSLGAWAAVRREKCGKKDPLFKVYLGLAPTADQPPASHSTAGVPALQPLFLNEVWAFPADGDASKATLQASPGGRAPWWAGFS